MSADQLAAKLDRAERALHEVERERAAALGQLAATRRHVERLQDALDAERAAFYDCDRALGEVQQERDAASARANNLTHGARHVAALLERERTTTARLRRDLEAIHANALGFYQSQTALHPAHREQFKMLADYSAASLAVEPDGDDR